MSTHYYKTKSKSRTFAKESDLGNIVQYLYDNIDAETIEVKGTTNLDPPEWHTKTTHKVIITITRVEQ